MTDPQPNANCKHCGFELPVEHVGPCPNCGRRGKIVHKYLSGSVSSTGTLSLTRIREYYEQNPKALWFFVSFTVASIALGFLLGGIPGVIIGVVLDVIAYFVTPAGHTIVRELWTKEVD